MPKTQEIKTSLQWRSFKLDPSAIDEEKRTVAISFSSEAPVERPWGIEILDHSPNSVILDRLNDGGAVLFNHDTGKHIGVVESASIGSDRVGRATVRFGRGALAAEKFQDVVDGVLPHISVGYVIHKEERTAGEGNAPDTYVATRWEPHEVSFVPIPADTSVGVGRDSEQEFTTTIIDKRERKMPDEPTNPAPAPAPQPEPVAPVAPTHRAGPSNEDVLRRERERVADIQQLGETYKQRELANKFIAEGKSLDEFRGALLKAIGTPVPTNAADIGMSEKETRSYNLMKALRYLAAPQDRSLREAAAFEIECSEEARRVRPSVRENGLTVPAEVLRRDLTVGTATAGGNLVATDLLSGSFIEMLRNASLMMQLGTPLRDLNGDVAVPSQTGSATAYWVAESGAGTESQPAFGQVTLTPKTVTTYTDLSRKLIKQSSLDVQALVQRDLAQVLGLGIDLAAINGSGSSNQPTGIMNTTGIGSVAGGTNGAVPTWGNIVDLETQVAQDNADVGRLAYVTNAKVRGKMKQTEKASSTAAFIWEAGEMNGYKAWSTNQVPSNLTKGTGSNLSAILFGNWADLLIGMWGGLDLLVDPYTNSTSGTVRLTAFQDVDIAVRNAVSFAAMVDAITA